MSADIDFLKAIRDWDSLTNYSRVLEIIKRMKQDERERLKSYVQFAYNNSETKPCQLLSVILQGLEQNTEPAEADIRKLLCENCSDEAFNMLVLRLREKIDDFLVSPINIEREGSYFHIKMQESYRIHRRTELLSVLNTKGLNEELILTANKNITRAKKREEYETLLKLLYIKLNILQVRINDEAYLDEILDEAAFYERCRYAVIRSRYWYNKKTGYVDFQGNRKGAEALFSEAIKELRKEFKFTNSYTVAYYLHQVEIEYYIETGKYVRAEKAAKELLEVVKHEAIYRKNTEGTALYLLAYVMLYQRKFTAAIKYAQAGKKCFDDLTHNYALGEEFEFYSLFYTDQFDKAEQKIRNILSGKYSRFIDDKRRYLYACTLFINGKYKECCRELGTISEINKDREGWNIGIRVLTILAFGELREYDVIAGKIEAFRQHLSEHALLDAQRKREVTIYRILNDWVKAGMNYKEVYSARSQDFQLLQSDDPCYCWQVRSPELIIFHEWFRSRSTGAAYSSRLWVRPARPLAV